MPQRVDACNQQVKRPLSVVAERLPWLVQLSINVLDSLRQKAWMALIIKESRRRKVLR